MPHRHLFAVNLVCPFHCPREGAQMGDDLMPEEVEVDPFGSRSSFRTTEHFAVKGARLVQVMDGKGQVKTRSVRHDLNAG